MVIVGKLVEYVAAGRNGKQMRPSIPNNDAIAAGRAMSLALRSYFSSLQKPAYF